MPADGLSGRLDVRETWTAPDTAKNIGPEKLSDQGFVEKFKKTELSTKEKIMEFFSSHLNIAKRLQALE